MPYPLVNVRWEYRNPVPGKTGGQDILVHYSHLGLIAGCELPQLTPTYIDNLCRLGLAEVPALRYYTTTGVYDHLENDSKIKAIQEAFEKDSEKIVLIERRGLNITQLGRQFAEVCAVRKA